MKRYVWGVLLVLFGALLLLVKLNVLPFTWTQLWPALILFAGLTFEVFGLVGGRSSCGLLVPGGILLVYGALFLACSLVSWDLMGELWPLYLVGPAVGLFSLYLFGEHEKGLLIPVGILGALGVGFLLNNLFHVKLMLPVLLILAGIIVILGGLRKPQKKE